MQSSQSLPSSHYWVDVRNPCPAGSEGSPPLSVLERENTPFLPQRSVGQGEERVSSLIHWGRPHKGSLKQPLLLLKFLLDLW
jgi:hypothetical protein